MGRPASPVPVCFVTAGAQLGGAERYLETLMLQLGSRWVQGAVCLADGPFEQRLADLGLPVVVLSTPGRLGLLRAVAKLRRLLRRRCPEVVHANGVQAALACSLAATGLGIPVLWLKVDLARDGVVAWGIATGCRRIVGISSTVLETFPRPLSRRTAVVYAAIPPLKAERRAARRLVLELTGFSAEAEIVVVSGRVSPGKGQLDLIESAPRILAARPSVRFAVLGGEDVFFPGYEAELRERARQLAVDHAIAFLGHRPAGIASADDAARFVGGCDLLAAPSVRQAGGGWREGFGLAPVEALYLGTPVVAYASGALPEVLEGCAVLVSEGDREALARAIVESLGNPDDRAALVERGRRRVRERFSIQRAAAEMAGHYSELARR